MVPRDRDRDMVTSADLECDGERRVTDCDREKLRAPEIDTMRLAVTDTSDEKVREMVSVRDMDAVGDLDADTSLDGDLDKVGVGVIKIVRDGVGEGSVCETC